VIADSGVLPVIFALVFAAFAFTLGWRYVRQHRWRRR